MLSDRSQYNALLPFDASRTMRCVAGSTSDGPFVRAARNSLSYRSYSFTSRFAMASAAAASVPGRMGTHSSAFSAAPDICGSKFTSLQPFARASANTFAVMLVP